MSPIPAFAPLLGLIPTPTPQRVSADVQKRPSRKRAARVRRRPSRKRAPPSDDVKTATLTSAPRATISPAPRVMNALVAAWLVDAALHAPKAAPVHVSANTGAPAVSEATVSRSALVRLLSAMPWRRRQQHVTASSEPSPTSHPNPNTAEATDESVVLDPEAETAARTSALYRSLYFSATTSGDGGVSARALAEQLRCDAETCARDAARLGARAVPAFLLADQSPAGVDLLEEVRAVWRRKVDSGRTNLFTRIFGALSLAPFLLNPLRH